MAVPARVRRWSGAVVCALGLLTGGFAIACAADHPAAVEAVGAVDIIVDLTDVEQWEARGPLVDAGAFCPSGRRHLLAAFDPDSGDEMQLFRYFAMFDDLRSAGDRPDALLLVEHACDDGTGTFVAAENQQRGTWEVRSGTGRYAGLVGAGSMSFVVDLGAMPAELYVVADVAIEPPP